MVERSAKIWNPWKEDRWMLCFAEGAVQNEGARLKGGNF